LSNSPKVDCIQKLRFGVAREGIILEYMNSSGVQKFDYHVWRVAVDISGGPRNNISLPQKLLLGVGREKLDQRKEEAKGICSHRGLPTIFQAFSGIPNAEISR